MAVYTSISHAEVQALLDEYGLGTLKSLDGIGAGIENSNFFVTTDQGRWVLTIFERLTEDQLPYYLNLMAHLASKGVACAAPVKRPKAVTPVQWQTRVANKPAAIVQCLPGNWLPAPSVAASSQVGTLLAQMHIAAQDFSILQPNQRNLAWCQEAAKRVAQHLQGESRQLLDDSLAEQIAFHESGQRDQLPASAVHADLFRDNVLFHQGKLSGAIDFYFAGDDCWLYDLATTVNDWCIDDDTGQINRPRYDALMASYQTIRRMTSDEVKAWPMMLRMSALRFWISRLDDWYNPRPASQLTPKDPTHFERILRLRTIAAPLISVTP